MPGHIVEQEMGLPAEEILDVIRRSDRCYQTVRGYVAERHLEKVLERLKRERSITDFQYVLKEGEPDFLVTSDKNKVSKVECKNVLGRKNHYANGDPKVDFQRTRNQLGAGARTGRYYKASEFDILAACLWNQTKQWEFRYIRTRDMPQVKVQRVACLVKAVRVPQNLEGTPWSKALQNLL